MQRLRRPDLEDLLYLRGHELDNLQSEGFVSLAFGAAAPGKPGDFYDVDAVCLAINFALTPTIGRDTATTIVLRFGAMILALVARAEADRTQDYFLGVGAFGVRDEKRKIPKLYGVASGTMEELRADFQGHEEPLKNAVLCNVSDILRKLRFNARELGINFEDEIFYLPDDPRFAEIQRLVEKEIKARTTRLRTDKKKQERAKDRTKRQDIRYLSSTSTVYPIEMVIP